MSERNWERERVCVHKSERLSERNWEGESVFIRVRDWVRLIERERVCVYKREIERECVFKSERLSERDCKTERNWECVSRREFPERVCVSGRECIRVWERERLFSALTLSTGQISAEWILHTYERLENC